MIGPKELSEDEIMQGYDFLEANYPDRTLCQIIREIYQLTRGQPSISRRCAEAIYRAKRLRAALDLERSKSQHLRKKP